MTWESRHYAGKAGVSVYSVIYYDYICRVFGALNKF